MAQGTDYQTPDQLSLSNPLSKPRLPNPVLFRVGGRTAEAGLDRVEWDGDRMVEKDPMSTQLSEIRPYGVLIVVPDQLVCW